MLQVGARQDKDRLIASTKNGPVWRRVAAASQAVLISGPGLDFSRPISHESCPFDAALNQVWFAFQDKVKDAKGSFKGGSTEMRLVDRSTVAWSLGSPAQAEATIRLLEPSSGLPLGIREQLLEFSRSISASEAEGEIWLSWVQKCRQIEIDLEGLVETTDTKLFCSNLVSAFEAVLDLADQIAEANTAESEEFENDQACCLRYQLRMKPDSHRDFELVFTQPHAAVVIISLKDD